jgi:hypothetical protein
MTNFATLAAQFDPHYALQTRKLDHYIEAANAKYDIARFNADAAIQREHVRGGYEMDKEHFRANRDDARQNKAIDAQYDIERMRGETSTAVERMRGENNTSLAQLEHENAIVRMEKDLQNHVSKIGVDSGVLAVQKLIDQDNSKRASLLDQIEARSNLRGEVFKMLSGAIIQEKLAQKQHARDMEKLEKERAMNRADEYSKSLVLYLTNLIDTGNMQAAKDEIDRLVNEWERLV